MAGVAIVTRDTAVDPFNQKIVLGDVLLTAVLTAVLIDTLKRRRA